MISRSEEEAEKLNKIKKSIKLAKELLVDLLEIAKNDTSRKEFEKVLDLLSILRELEKEF